MSATKSAPFIALAMVLGASCGGREPTPPTLDCTIQDQYEFRNIADFTGMDSGWYVYADPTPVPATQVATQAAVTLDAPRCGDTRALRLEAHGYNFWGSGFADWTHESSKADGTGFEGISFWARTGKTSERTFMLYADDGRTVVMTRAKPVNGVVIDGVCKYVCTAAAILDPEDPDAGVGVEYQSQCIVRGGPLDHGAACTPFQPASPDDEDVNGDGILGPGDMAVGTTCRVPPVQKECDPACYYGGSQPPTASTCVPTADQCGNQFHKYITTTEEWQLFLIPFSELAQWPCPNRLAGGIDPSDVRKFEIKLRQGSSYEIWLDNFAFYRRR